jgi:YidC/Oxa1 family membrane protein insertase
MDRKTILVFVAAFGVLFLYNWGVGKLFPPTELPPGTNLVAGATNVVVTNQSAATSAPSINAVAPAPVPAVTNAPAPVVPPGTPEDTVKVETAEAIYTFTSHGGGVKSVQLKKYTESIRSKAGVSNELVSLNEHGRAAVLALQIEGASGDNVFKLVRTPTNTVIAEKVLPSGLRMVKSFEPGSNHTLRVQMWIENTTDQTMAVPPQTVHVGAATLAGPDESPMMSGVFWYNGEKAEHLQDGWFDNYAFACFGKRPRFEYDSGVNRVLWAAVHNQFFALAVLPATNAVASQFKAHRFELPAASSPTKKAGVNAFDGALVYSATNLPPKQFIERQYVIYAGPKEEKILARLGRETDAIMDFGFFGPISKFFLRGMNLLSKVMPYGLAIIVMTIFIKLVFWPLTQASTRSMKRMQALQPELKKLQEKYKEDPAKLNKKMMEFWREHKVNPMSGCWPMLIQLPIFFALFRMIPNAIELRGTPFLWIADLSRPDTIFYIPGFDWPFNPLPLIMGATMLWQAKLMPPSPGMDPAQQKMMKYMPMIFMIFLYGQPAGLTLYWTVQNLLSILQTKLTNAKEEPSQPAPVPAAVQRKKQK